MNSGRRRFLNLAAASLFATPVFRNRDAVGQSGERTSLPDKSLVTQAKHLGNQFLGNGVHVTGMDGATSTLLPSGESMWVFGDTVEGAFESIHGLDLSGLSSNTAAIVPPQDTSRGIQHFKFLTTRDGKRPRQLVPFAADENPATNRVWAIHGVCVAQKFYLFYHRVTLQKGVDVFTSFQLDGMGIARSDIGDEYRFRRLVAPDGSREFWKGDEPSFGVFVQQVADHIYLWGCLQTVMYLARTRPDSIEDLASYEYLVEAPDSARPNFSARWAKTFEPTARLFDGVPNEMSASYNRHLDCYVAFHSLHREHKIVMRTAPRIFGPWSDGEIVFRPERIADGDLIYAAKEHPELAQDNGRVMYVTFVNSTTYVPQLIQLTLK